MVFDEESILREKSKTEDKDKEELQTSSTDSQEKGVEFSDSPKKPDGSNEDFSYSNRDEQEAIQKQSRPLR